jgi:hypothetical protein
MYQDRELKCDVNDFTTNLNCPFVILSISCITSQEVVALCLLKRKSDKVPPGRMLTQASGKDAALETHKSEVGPRRSNIQPGGESATVRDKGPRNCGVDLRFHITFTFVVACSRASPTAFILSLLQPSLPLRSAIDLHCQRRAQLPDHALTHLAFPSTP